MISMPHFLFLPFHPQSTGGHTTNVFKEFELYFFYGTIAKAQFMYHVPMYNRSKNLDVKLI